MSKTIVNYHKYQKILFSWVDRMVIHSIYSSMKIKKITLYKMVAKAC